MRDSIIDKLINWDEDAEIEKLIGLSKDLYTQGFDAGVRFSAEAVKLSAESVKEKGAIDKSWEKIEPVIRRMINRL